MLMRISCVRCFSVFFCTNALTVALSHACLFRHVLPGGSHAHIYFPSRDVGFTVTFPSRDVGFMVTGGQRWGVFGGDEVDESWANKEGSGIQNCTNARTCLVGVGGGISEWRCVRSRAYENGHRFQARVWGFCFKEIWGRTGRGSGGGLTMYYNKKYQVLVKFLYINCRASLSCLAHIFLEKRL